MILVYIILIKALNWQLRIKLNSKKTLKNLWLEQRFCISYCKTQCCLLKKHQKVYTTASPSFLFKGGGSMDHIGSVKSACWLVVGLFWLAFGSFLDKKKIKITLLRTYNKGGHRRFPSILSRRAQMEAHHGATQQGRRIPGHIHGGLGTDARCSAWPWPWGGTGAWNEAPHINQRKI